MSLVVVLVAGAVALTASACGRQSTPTGPRVGVAYDDAGPGGPAFTALARAGIASIKPAPSEVREFYAKPAETEEDKYDRLVILCQSKHDPVIAMGSGYAGRDPAHGPLARAAAACPDTQFASVDDGAVTAPNVANLVFADTEGGYLMGVAAASLSHPDQVGFLGGCRIPAIEGFEAGYRAGVREVRPDIAVHATYLAQQPSCAAGFGAVNPARTAADALYDGGADVVFEVVGAGAPGVFASARAHDALAIGSYTDSVHTADAALRDAIATSMVKRIDIVLSRFIHACVAGTFTAGITRYGLADGAIDYVTADRMAAVVPRLTDARQRIVAGTVVVPDTVG
jgi:basic membrane protein A